MRCFPATPVAAPLRMLAAALLAAAALAGCATGGTVATTAPARAEDDATVQQARALANTAASATGAERATAERALERLLAGLGDMDLQRVAAALPPGDPLYDFAGRALLQRGLPLPRAFDRGQAWRFDAGGRPAAERDGYRPPVKLAVLLPLTGDLAVAATPVRDGFLAGYYGETRRRPEVRFYNTSGTVAGALAAYDRAVAEGNDFVVGPLGRDEVSALYARTDLPVPMLALNRGSARPPSGHASFSLSPEDEGSAAADYLLQRGAKRVLVVSGADDTQRRTVQALRDRLGERGGEVTDVLTAEMADFVPFAQKGVDAVYLAVRGAAARTVMPKLALAGLTAKPVVGSSQLVSGGGTPAENAALDGIAFPTEPWQQREIPGLPSAATAAQTLPTAKGAAARLFAFGYDAWRLAAYLERLVTTADGALDGATGTLRVDGFGTVLRTPAWATYRGGVAMPLPAGDRR